MTVNKWIEIAEEREVEIGADDIRCALGEAFARTKPRDEDDHPHRGDVLSALNSIAQFLNAFDDNLLALIGPQRRLIADFLRRSADKFAGPSSVQRSQDELDEMMHRHEKLTSA